MNQTDKSLIRNYIKNFDFEKLELIVNRNLHTPEGKFMLNLINISKLIVHLLLIGIIFVVYKLIF